MRASLHLFQGSSGGSVTCSVCPELLFENVRFPGSRFDPRKKAHDNDPDHKGDQANDGVCLPLLPPLLTLARGGSGSGSRSGSGGGNGKLHGDPICQRRWIGPHPIRPIANGTGWLCLENVSNLLDGVIREKQVLQC